MSHRPFTSFATLLAIAVLAGCGGDDDRSDTGQSTAGAGDFPAAEGRSLEQLASETGVSQDIVVSPAGQTYELGRNRFSFGVFETNGNEVAAADVALYVAHGPGGAVRGPLPARVESLQTDPAFASKTAAAESQPVTVAYVSDVQFDQTGEWRVVAVIKRGDDLVASRLPSINVAGYEKIPDVGEAAPRIHTPTTDDVGDISEIDTRIPPDTMHEDDLYDVVGKQPVVLLFATPALCQSRVCGPMVDVEEQVHSETDDDVAFIHVEVYRNNDPNQGVRPELTAYGLQTEPWLFVLDDRGRVSARIEGAFSVEELEDAVAKVRLP